jgi:hypothetical protein
VTQPLLTRSLIDSLTLPRIQIAQYPIGETFRT